MDLYHICRCKSAYMLGTTVFFLSLPFADRLGAATVASAAVWAAALDFALQSAFALPSKMTSSSLLITAWCEGGSHNDEVCCVYPDQTAHTLKQLQKFLEVYVKAHVLGFGPLFKCVQR